MFKQTFRCKQEKNQIENCRVLFMISKPREYRITKARVRTSNYSQVTKLKAKVVVYDRKVKISPTLDLPVLGKSEDDDGEFYTK